MPRRKKSPNDQFTGITLEQWHADVDNLTWTQREPRYRLMMSVLLNECKRAHTDPTINGCSEGRAFGRVEGFHMALEVLRDMGRKPEKPPRDLIPTYDEPHAIDA